jgi:multidrug efflux pump
MMELQERSPRSSSRIPTSRPSPRSSARTARTRRRTAAALDHAQAARRAQADADEIIARLQPKLAKVEGIDGLPAVGAGPADRQPRQPHAVPVHARGRDPKELATWAPKLLAKLKTLPSSRTSRATSRRRAADVAHDRPRHGVAPGHLAAAIDDTLYDAFGQRQVSIIFTQLNQYRVILEVKPEFQQNPERARQDLRAHADGDQVPLSRSCKMTRRRRRSPSTTRGSSRRHALVQPAPGRRARRRGRRHPRRRRARSAAAERPRRLRRDAQAFNESLASEPILILAALITVYIVLGVLYESYIHPITILSTLPSAGRRRAPRADGLRTEFSVIALIGIILLIGIVKKNAIMMIDFALEAERDRAVARGVDLHRRACCASGPS